MRFQKKIKQIFIAIVMSLFITGIIPGMPLKMPHQIVNVEAASQVKLNKTKATLIKGKSLQLKISGARKNVVWSTSNKKVAVVNNKGKVTTKSNGKVTITARVGNKKYNCKITVETPKISKTSVTMYEKGTYTLKLLKTNQKVTWKSNRTSVATINSKGKITAKKAGTATITATVSGIKYSCKVTVKKAKTPYVKIPDCVAQQTMYAVGSNKNNKGILDIPDCFIYIKNLDVNAKVTDVKSSNPKLKASKREDIDAIEVEGISDAHSENLVGVSSVISFNVIQNGKTYSLSCRIDIKEKASPFVSFKIGSHDFARDFIGCNYVTAINYKGKQKVYVEMTPDYVLDSLHVLYKKNGEYTGHEIKNGSVVDLDDCVFIKAYYHTNRKPANYTESTKWYGVTESPLHRDSELNLM